MRTVQYIILFLALVGAIILAFTEKGYYHILDSQSRYASESSNVFFPDTVLFCGEVIPMTEPDVKARFEREIAIYTKYNATTRLLIRRANKWFPQFDKILEQQGVPQDLKYIVAVESAFTNVRSNKGAVGFWQIRAITGRTFGLTINDEIDERLNPIRATWAATKYFKMAYKIFGEWTMAAASYNLGINGLKRRVAKQQPETFYDLELNSETSRYLFKALAFKEVFEHPDKYGIYPQISQTKKIPQKVISEPIADLSEYASKMGSHPDSIRKYNPWILGNYIPVNAGESITIFVPEIFQSLQEPNFYQVPMKSNSIADEVIAR